jgi:small GTP-binding protein
MSRAPEILREETLERLDAEEERARLSVPTASVQASSSSSAAMKRFKLLMLGDSGVGKSSLMIRWTEDSFSTDLVGTVGVNFKTKREVVGGEFVHAQVWDTAGQEQFHKITTSYYKGAHGIMLVYDVSDPKSWDNIQYWVKNIRAHASESVQVVLVGNKVDLREDGNNKCVKPSLGKSFSKKFGVPYFETSAKSSVGVSQAFSTLLGSIITVTDMIEKNNLAARKLISDRLPVPSNSCGSSGGGCLNSSTHGARPREGTMGSSIGSEYECPASVGIGESGANNHNSKRSTKYGKTGEKCVIS